MRPTVRHLLKPTTDLDLPRTPFHLSIHHTVMEPPLNTACGELAYLPHQPPPSFPPEV